MTRSILAVIVVATATSLTTTACIDRPEGWSAPQRLLGPYRVADRVLWVEAGRGLVAALEPAGREPRVHLLTIGRNALFATPSPARDRLVVLTAGKEALRRDQQPEAPTLTVVDPGAGSSAPTVERRFLLEAAFDRVALDHAGRWAVAHYSEQAAQAIGAGEAQAVFRNPNQVALFDLHAEPGADNPRLRTLRSFGSAPLGVVFSPPLAIPPGEGTGAQRTLAVILSRSYLTIVDMDHRQRSEITVPLTPADSEAAVVPQQVLFAADQATIFVRAAGVEDLFSLTLESKIAKGSQDNDFWPSINQSSSGKAVKDMLLLEGDGRAKLLAVNETDLSLIDPATSELVTIRVGEPIDTIVAVPPATPGQAPQLALLYDRASPRARVHLLSLSQLAERREANLVRRALARPVHQLVPVPGAKQALVVHNDARDVVSLLDLVGEHHTDTPIQGRARLHSYDFAAGDYLVGVTPGVARLGVLDLRNLHPLDLRLDHDPQRVIAVGDRVVIDHGAAVGLATVVPRPDAEREQCHVLWGFLLDGLLDRAMED